ncbi:MAG: hypothetical protein Q4G59_07290 [Planctomycetia bacterium]|nr:hypothetical protein [Planctomycetia bacterium]
MRKNTLGYYVSGCLLAAALLFACGCALQKGKVLDDNDPMRTGSHKAGSEVYDPAADSAVSGLLAKAEGALAERGNTGQGKSRVCFIGVENAGAEEMGDLKQDLDEMIRTKITQSPRFETIDSRTVAAALRKTGMRSDDLLLPESRGQFVNALGGMGSSFDYILFAKVTTATTRDNKDSQVKYALTLDLVDVNSGAPAARESVALRKNYNKSAKAKVFGLF